MKKFIFLSALLLTIAFLTFPQANAVTITATPQSPNFGPNDWIVVNLSVQGYNGGPITWMAHRPDNSTISGTIYEIRGGVATHQIVRDAFDNYFGTWSIDYTYNGVTQTAYVKVNPIILTVTTDKDLYFEPDVMKINITTSYYVPVAQEAGFYHLNFYDKQGNPATDVLQHDIRAFQQSMVYNFPLSELAKYNPAGLYKLRVQYFNKFVEVPFLLGEYSTFMQISALTDKASYHVDEDVNLDLLFTRVTKSEGILKITDPSGNTTSHQFNVDSVHTSLVLKDITNKIGTYVYEIQYADVSKRGSFDVVSNPKHLPNIELEIFLDKLNYRLGEIIHAKIHTSQLIANSITLWAVDPNGTDHQRFSLPISANDIVLPHKVGKTDAIGLWELYVDYGGIIKSVPFFVKGDSVNDEEMLNTDQFSIPSFVSTFGSSYLNKPAGIAVDSNGDVYVTDSGDSKVKKFDSNGKLILSWGDLGSNREQLRHPNGVIAGKKYVFVADTGNSRIQMFDKDGNFIYSWGGYGDDRGMFHTPLGLGLDSGGDLFVADSGRDTIQIFDPGDVYMNEIRPILTEGGNFSAINGIVFDSHDSFYASAVDNKILKFSDIGNFINFYGSAGTGEGRFNNPTALAIDSKGNFYVADTDNHRIQKFDPYGNFILSWGSEGKSSGQFEEPVGLTTDSSDNIYVVDKGNNNIQKFSLYGSVNKTIIPSWVKDNAMWWSQGGLDKNDFAQVIRYLINQGLIKNTETNQAHSVKIPSWVKTDAAWWTSGEIEMNTFVQTLQYLIYAGIVKA